MAVLSLGSKGEQLNLVIKQGADFGPFLAEMENPDGSPVNLTGCTFQGRIKKTSTSPVAAVIDFTITDPLLGAFAFTIPNERTAIPCGESDTDKASRYVWDAELIDAAGHVTPVYFGDVAIFRNI